MGPLQARVQLDGYRLGIEWPAMAACGDLTVRCRPRDGTVHESASWQPAPGAVEQYRASCGPLAIELMLRPADGCVRMQVAATTTMAAEVSEVTVVATAT